MSRVPVQEGQTVAKGAVMATISDPALQAEIDTAESKVAEARANVAACLGDTETSPTAQCPERFLTIWLNLTQKDIDNWETADYVGKVQQPYDAGCLAAAKPKVTIGAQDFGSLVSTLLWSTSACGTVTAPEGFWPSR